MKSKLIVPALFCLLVLSLLACQKKNKYKPTTSSISLEKLTNSPSYADAKLSLQQPDSLQKALKDTINFVFNTEHYTLKAQTESGNTTLLSNSSKGQHIHFILNNQPYAAHYSTSFTKTLPQGVHHLVAFLSRSYHESVKNDHSVVVRKVQVGQEAKDNLNIDMKAPCLIYSRPKGTYQGADTKNILLDFFVLNTTLSKEGNKVKAIINGETFKLTEWTPYIIKGLPMGEVTIELELINADGQPIEGPFNHVKRIINLKAN